MARARPITRRFAEKCADALYMQLEMNEKSVRGKKTVVLDLGGVKFPFELEVKGWFGDTEYGGADAGLILQGPGSLAVALLRYDGRFLLRLLDVRDLAPKHMGKPWETVAKWWSSCDPFAEAKDFLDCTAIANRGTFERKKGVWSAV